MTETIIAAVLAAIGAVVGFFFYGRRVQSQVDSGKSVKAALKAIETALNDNKERAKHDATTLNDIPGAWANDDDDLHFRMPGGATSPSNKPPGV